MTESNEDKNHVQWVALKLHSCLLNGAVGDTEEGVPLENLNQKNIISFSVIWIGMLKLKEDFFSARLF